MRAMRFYYSFHVRCVSIGTRRSRVIYLNKQRLPADSSAKLRSIRFNVRVVIFKVFFMCSLLFVTSKTYDINRASSSVST